jgi:hypothetical protein
MPSYDEQELRSAVDAVNSGRRLRAVARETHIPYTTLHDRVEGATSNQEVNLPRQRLSPEEESFLAAWARNEEAAGRAPTKAQLMRMASSIIAQGGCSRPVGKSWVDRFLARHDSVKTKNSTSLDQERRKGSTKEVYEDFFKRLKYQIDSKNIPARYIANVDEHGIQETETAKHNRVISDSKTGKAYKEGAKSTPWITVIESVTADGRRLTPAVVFTGASL